MSNTAPRRGPLVTAYADAPGVAPRFGDRVRWGAGRAGEGEVTYCLTYTCECGASFGPLPTGLGEGQALLAHPEVLKTVEMYNDPIGVLEQQCTCLVVEP